MKNEEHQIQTCFVQRVRHLRQELLIAAIPNGGLRHPKVAAQLKSEGVLAGMPDLIIAKPTAKHAGLFLEFKTKKGRTSDAQKKVIAKLKAEGYAVNIVRSADEAWKTLMQYLSEEI